MSAELLFVLILLVMVGLGAALVFARLRSQAPFLSAEDKALVHVQWHQVETHLKKGGPTHFRQAIIEADKLVDHCLRGLGVSGESFGERLRHGKARFSDYEGLWQAHKTRNQIVHELNKEILSFEAKRVIGQFKRALIDLGVL